MPELWASLRLRTPTCHNWVSSFISPANHFFAPIHRPTGSSSLIWMFVGKYRQAHAGTTGDPDPAPTDYRLRWAPATGDFLSYKDADGES